MINFRHLKVEQCPTCGCSTIVAESIQTDAYYSFGREPRIRQHTNGQRWETRKFLCGCTVQWVPNFSCPEVTTVCPKHPAIIKYYQDSENISAKEREIHETRQKLSQVDREVRAAVTAELIGKKKKQPSK